MFDIDKYMHKPFFERECRPEPPCGFGPPHEKPRYTMTEEVEHTARLMRETIDRLLKFEERAKRELSDLSKNVMSDNVIFKNAMHESWTTFLMEVKNEINVFEANMESDVKMFKAEIESNYATLSEDVHNQIAENLATFEQKVADFEAKYEKEFTDLTSSIQEQYNAFVASVNQRIDNYNENTAQAFADFKRQMQTQLNTFEQTMETNYATFTESVGNSIHEFRETWEQIITERLAAQDAVISDAEMYMKTNLEHHVETLIGDMHANGEFTDIIEGEVFNDLQRKVDGFGRVSVLYFGAVGDGVTDNTAAFNLAFATGKPLYIPRGEYVVGDLTLDKECDILGESPDTVKFRCGTIAVNKRCTVRNIHFAGNAEKPVIQANSGLDMEDCYIYGGRVGIQFTNEANKHVVTASFKRLTVAYNKDGAIIEHTGVSQKNNILFEQVYFVKNGVNADDLTADGTGLTNGYGLKINGGYGIEVRNCVFEYNTGVGLYLGVPSGSRLDGCVVSTPYFEQNKYANCYVDNSGFMVRTTIQGEFYSDPKPLVANALKERGLFLTVGAYLKHTDNSNHFSSISDNVARGYYNRYDPANIMPFDVIGELTFPDDTNMKVEDGKMVVTGPVSVKGLTVNLGKGSYNLTVEYDSEKSVSVGFIAHPDGTKVQTVAAASEKTTHTYSFELTQNGKAQFYTGEALGGAVLNIYSIRLHKTA